MFEQNDDSDGSDFSAQAQQETSSYLNATDTLIVPTGKSGGGFEDVFLNENSWYYLRISENKLKQFKCIAAYRPAPVSAVTHIAEIDKFVEVLSERGQPRQKVVFKTKAVEIGHIPFGTAKSGSMQGPRYVNSDEILRCTDLGKLL